MWEHQTKAIQSFIEHRHGILEMATGTGKTRTAIRIMKQLLVEEKIDQIIIIVYGNDLLEQWYKELMVQDLELRLYRWFDKYNEFSRFQLYEGKKILLLSREPQRVGNVLRKQGSVKNTFNIKDRTLLVFDEVHGAGSAQFKEALDGLVSQYQYRLGLSATPVREFDEEGTEFLIREIGPLIYTFGLEEAIRKGILCGFFYIPLHYTLTPDERNKKRKIIAAYEMKRKNKQPVQKEEMYRDLARINKLAENKIPVFQLFIASHLEILKDCIIFVETKEYGFALQSMLLTYMYRFHTYYGEDDRKNLDRFAKGEIQCLITCKKISEGIDIRTVKNIVLFSSDRGHLVTTQRIGRSLRRNPEEPEKIATIVDFICDYENTQTEDITADMERENWLYQLSKVRSDD